MSFLRLRELKWVKNCSSPRYSALQAHAVFYFSCPVIGVLFPWKNGHLYDCRELEPTLSIFLLGLALHFLHSKLVSFRRPLMKNFKNICWSFRLLNRNPILCQPWVLDYWNAIIPNFFALWSMVTLFAKG